MGPEIIIPVVLLTIIVPTTLAWAKRNLRDPSKRTGVAADAVPAPSRRLTSAALRELPSPRWRVVHEIDHTKLGGVEHVLIGPPGVFAIQTSMDPVPTEAEPAPKPADVARSAIVRGDLDELLARCTLESDRLVVVYWGAGADDHIAIETLPGRLAVEGRELARWAAELPDRLTETQVDLAWQTVATGIGRPDPLG